MRTAAPTARRPSACSSAFTTRPTPDAPARARRTCEARPGDGRRPRIGAAIAERLHSDGLEVTTLDRAEGCDLTLDLVNDELPDLAHIDVCVSNAAITDTIAPAHRMTGEQWSRDIDVNLTRQAGPDRAKSAAW